MADVTSVSQTYPNAGVSEAGGVLGLNFEQLVNTQGLSGRFIVVSIAKGTGSATEAQLASTLKALGSAGGSGTGTDINGPDAFTVVGFNAATLGTDPAYAVLQGTGTLSTGAGDYVADITVSEVVTFGLAV